MKNQYIKAKLAANYLNLLSGFILSFILSTIMFCFIFINFSHAEVYKFVKPDGTILLTDNPKKGAEEVNFTENTWSSASSKRADVQQILNESRDLDLKSSSKSNVNNKSKLEKQQSIKVLYPSDDAYIRNGLGELIVKTDAELKEGQALKASIDGNLDDTMHEQASFLVKSIQRGEHTLLVYIVEKKSGNIVTTSDPIKFFMYRNIIEQNRPIPIK